MSEQACRHCGCTKERACEGGCSWVLDDVCSQCVTQADIITYLRRYAELIVVPRFLDGSPCNTPLAKLPDHARSDIELYCVSQGQIPPRLMTADELIIA